MKTMNEDANGLRQNKNKIYTRKTLSNRGFITARSTRMYLK